MQLATHAQRLERWLGVEHVEQLSKNMAEWYGPPIPVAGVPGNVWAMKGGDFRGRIGAGQFSPAVDFVEQRLKRIARDTARTQALTAGAGFASLSALIASATGGKRREFHFQKNPNTGVVGATGTLWRCGVMPFGGSVSAAAPGGRALTDATVGAYPFTNPSGGDTQHFVSGSALASVLGNNLLLYDRLFDVIKTINSTATEAVTGVPTRYQGIVSGADSAEGNFCFVEVGATLLANTAHNWTVCTYTDQGGSAGTFPAMVGNAACIADRIDHPVQSWFMPLASGDSGVQTLTQMQCSALVATGVVNFVLGHPIAWMPIPIANLMCQFDGINTAFNLARIFDDAALAMLEVSKPTTTATVYTGSFITVAG